MPLEEEEQRHVTSAQGFLELGMFLDADAELDRIDPFCRHLPEILEVRVQIYSALKKWELLAAVTKRLWAITDEPAWLAEHANALRQSGAIDSALTASSARRRDSGSTVNEHYHNSKMSGSDPATSGFLNTLAASLNKAFPASALQAYCEDGEIVIRSGGITAWIGEAGTLMGTASAPASSP